MLNEIDVKSLFPPLLAWYDAHHRTLPWRRDRDPYHIWVSEIMLQQTRVEAVIPYYERFLEALPSIADLAACEEDRLMKLWEGLGYYSRVRNMQKAARLILSEYGGSMPGSYEEILSLPGIGPYTAGAIASIAFHLPRPAVDGNVLRILARVSDDSRDILSTEMKKKTERTLLSAIPGDCPGKANQAMMDLGAMVCVPNGTPKCRECPWGEICLGRARGNLEKLPVRIKKVRRRSEERTVLLVMDGERVLLHKRPPRGLLAGLYELPNEKGALEEAQAIDVVRGLCLDPLKIEVLPEAKHLFSHIEWRMKGYLVRVADMGDDGGGVARTPQVWDDDYLLVGKKALAEDFSVPSAFGAYLKYI